MGLYVVKIKEVRMIEGCSALFCMGEFHCDVAKFDL